MTGVTGQGLPVTPVADAGRLRLSRDLNGRHGARDWITRHCNAVASLPWSLPMRNPLLLGLATKHAGHIAAQVGHLRSPATGRFPARRKRVEFLREGIKGARRSLGINLGATSMSHMMYRWPM